jgi:hypothetical protein
MMSARRRFDRHLGWVWWWAGWTPADTLAAAERVERIVTGRGILWQTQTGPE